MKKQHIGILFGGKSAEHEVSIQSAKNIVHTLKQSSHTSKLLYITRRGLWLEVSEEVFALPLSEFLTHMLAVEQQTMRRKGEFYLPSQIEDVTIFFPVLHGPYGEDGIMQAFLTLLDVPFVGSSVLGSAIGMDKDVMKRLLKQAGIPVAPFQVIYRYERPSLEFQKITKEFGLLFFIKPANLGSSIGVHQVTDEETFENALTDAFSFDTKILIEKRINARELECSVLGNDVVTISLPGEIIPKDSFYSYDAKYLNPEGATFSLPAEVSDEQLITIQELARQTYRVLCSSGLARIDFFLEKQTGEIYVNEINTLPGFTDISMYPALWEISGIGQIELLEKLLALGIERYTAEALLQTKRIN